MREHETIWTAESLDCVPARCAENAPDLLLLDVDGDAAGAVATIQRVMRETPLPVLVTSGAVDQQPGPVFQALGAGAIDVVRVPAAGGADAESWVTALLARIGMIARLSGLPSAAPPGAPRTAPRTDHLVVLGASAGGPAALATVLSALPAGFPAPVAVVQHIDAQLAPEMARWLNRQCRLDVRAARSGDRLEPGVVYVAVRETHMVLCDRHTLAYQAEPRAAAFHPSIDVFFHTVAAHWADEAVGVLLTGMGQDGAAGLRAIRETGALTIAQDQATSAVYGIPKAAVRMKAASEVLPLPRIARRLQEAVGALHLD